MKLISFIHNGKEKAGLLLHDMVYGLSDLHAYLPETMNQFMENWDYHQGVTRLAEMALKTDPKKQKNGIPLAGLHLLAPISKPGSLRDGYAFRQHVETARRNRGLTMISAFNEYPVFYFGNHRTVIGSGDVYCMEDHLQELDYELEIAAVISRTGKNIRAAEADEYIAGLMIMNDFSARKLQMEEMQLSLGPAKGKDFATATGPWLVTLDELKPFACAPAPGHTGKNWDLSMTAHVNGKICSTGTLADMHWTFAELIERASYGAELHPGDIIGSGTVGTGCFLETNGTHKLTNGAHQPQWLGSGDIIELEVEGLGILRNQIRETEEKFSILSLKKAVS